MGKRVRLDSIDPADRCGFDDKDAAEAAVAAAAERLAALQGRFILDGSRALLVVLQGTDASGKDGVTRKIVAAANPMSVRLAGFKKPTPLELSHDFLWRVHQVLPAKGEIGVFNRSHYEDILAVRVERIAPEAVWRPRYAAINAFEQHLANEGTTILKLMLWISKDEQLRRLEERRTDPVKMWKYSPDDIERRGRWDEYVAAYQDVLDETSTDWAPWRVVPADRKAVRDAVILGAIADALEAMDLPPAHIKDASAPATRS